MCRVLRLVPDVSCIVPYSTGVGPAPSSLADGVADVLFRRFDGPSSAICRGGDLRLSSRSTHVIMELWEQAYKCAVDTGWT
jgi:hypothetical protein